MKTFVIRKNMPIWAYTEPVIDSYTELKCVQDWYFTEDDLYDPGWKSNFGNQDRFHWVSIGIQEYPIYFFGVLKSSVHEVV